MAKSNIFISALLQNKTKRLIFSEEHIPALQQKLEELLQRNILYDIELVSAVDQKRLKTHRVVMYLNSNFLGCLLTYALHGANEIIVDNVPGDVLENLIKYCYTGKIELCAQSVQDILEAAVQLKMTKVVEICNNFICDQLLSSNCVEILRYADASGNAELLTETEAFISKQFAEVCKQKQFLKLSFDVLLRLLDKIDFTVDSETVCGCVLKWMQYDGSYRFQFVDNLLPLLKLRMLPPTYLVEQVQPLCVTPESKQLLIEALAYNIMPQSLPSVVKEELPRADRFNKLLVMCAEKEKGREKTHISIKFNIGVLTTWQTLQFEIQASKLQDGFEITSIADNVYFVGGRRNAGIPNDLLCLNLRTMSIEDLPRMPVPRVDHTVCSYEGFIFAIGGFDGFDGNAIFNTVERYDTRAKVWKNIASTSIARRKSAAVNLNKYLYVAGGCKGSASTETVERLYLESDDNKWTPCASMKMKRRDFGLAASKRHIYAVGGFDEKNNRIKSIEIYSPITDTWSELCSIIIDGPTYGCGFINGELYTVGFKNISNYIRVDKYDVNKKEWAIVNSLEINIFSFKRVIPLSFLDG